MTTPRVVGRFEALAAVDDLLGAAEDGPAALALSGPPGIGKTTVWLAALDRARERGLLVLAGRPSPAEVRLEYSGLREVLAPLADAVPHLPQPQQRALAAALGTEAAGPDGGPQLVAAAASSLLEVASARGPVLVAVDDLQWLDPSSHQALAYACRRVTGRLAVLTSARTSDDPSVVATPVPVVEPADPRRLTRLPLAPLTPADVADLAVAVAGTALGPAALDRLVGAADGNPLFAVQLATHWRRRGTGTLPANLRALVAERVRGLPRPTRDVLLTAACLADPRTDLLARVHGGYDDVSAAEDAGVVRIVDGRVRFVHPLFALGILDAAPPGLRRVRHRRLAEIVDGEARARHLAYAASGPESLVLEALDTAAGAARGRGATSVAAELDDLALGLGARSPQRLLQAAQDQLRIDSYGRAVELASEALPALVDPLDRARALGAVGQGRFRLGDLEGSVTALRSAVDLAAADDALRASLLGDLGTSLLNGGQVDLARSVIEEVNASSMSDGGVLAELVAARVVLGQLTGQGFDRAGARRALRLESPERVVPAIRWPTVNVAAALLFSGRPGDALPLLLAAERRCRVRGQETDLWFVQFYAARAATRLGELDTARAAVEALADRARQVDGPVLDLMARTAQAHLQAWTAQGDAGVATSRRAVEEFEALGAAHVGSLPASALASVLLARGDAAAVVELLRPLERLSVASGHRHPGFAGFLPDLVEALVATGRAAEAAAVLDRYEPIAARSGEAWLHGVLALGRAEVARALGDVESARGLLDDAFASFARRPDNGHERGRTLVARARLERRARRRAVSVEAARRAVAELDAVGCALWRDVARAEVDRSSAARSGGALTAMEERVCALAARGHTNREVATALGMSTKTVEAHLSRAYAKLGIRSRAELGARVPPGDAAGGKGNA
ncbi:AAA family ATPase [Isoptericola sp. F-RaC21]|uniref:ATP-binding protein n=1 Tax=Isoptericola sp. F-RaC21 TaxID=3141452 RepID=UPI00315B5BEF